MFENAKLHVAQALWSDFIDGNSLNTIVIRKRDGALCGFCGLQRFAEATGRTEFVGKVSHDDFRSQGMMGKLGGEAMSRLAQEFGITLRKLKSHVLVFHFSMGLQREHSCRSAESPRGGFFSHVVFHVSPVFSVRFSGRKSAKSCEKHDGSAA